MLEWINRKTKVNDSSTDKIIKVAMGRVQSKTTKTGGRIFL